MSVDKAQVRDDYVRGFSVRMLAAKYDVPKSTIGRWVKQFGWVQEAGAAQEERTRRKKEEWDTPRDRERDNGTWDVPPLPVADDYSKMRLYTDKLLAKADTLLDLDDKLSPKDLKSLSGMLLDVRTLLNILSPREAAEQEMRIAKLRKESQIEDQDGVGGVLMIPAINEAQLEEEA